MASNPACMPASSIQLLISSPAALCSGVRKCLESAPWSCEMDPSCSSRAMISGPKRSFPGSRSAMTTPVQFAVTIESSLMTTGSPTPSVHARFLLANLLRTPRLRLGRRARWICRRDLPELLDVLVEVDLDFSVKYAPCLVLVDILLPDSDDHGRHAVADEIAQRARHAHEPVN